MSVGVFFHQSVGFGSIPRRKPNECFFILGVTLSWVLQHYYFPPFKKKKEKEKYLMPSLKGSLESRVTLRGLAWRTVQEAVFKDRNKFFADDLRA